MRNEKWVISIFFKFFVRTQNERAPYVTILNACIFIYIRARSLSLSLSIFLSLLLSLSLSVARSPCFPCSSLSRLHAHTHTHYKKASPILVGFFGNKSRDPQILKGAIKRPRTRSAAARQASNTHEQDLVSRIRTSTLGPF